MISKSVQFKGLCSSNKNDANMQFAKGCWDQASRQFHEKRFVKTRLLIYFVTWLNYNLLVMGNFVIIHYQTVDYVVIVAFWFHTL